MAKLDSSVMTHEEVQQVLPWYANKRLDAATSRRVAAHLEACPICRGDVDGLSAAFAMHERSLPDRPVDERRLDALFGRIDAFETERRRQSQTVQRPSVVARAMQWLTAHSAVAAGALAAILIAVVIVPGLLQQPTNVGHEYSVLSSKNGATAPFAVKLSFAVAPQTGEVERLVAASAAESPSLPAHRIEQRSATEFLVVFDSKPSVVLVEQMLTRLAGSPNVTSATLDPDSAADAAPAR